MAIGLGNASYDPSILAVLEDMKSKVSSLVLEHIEWAITQQLQKNSLDRKTQRLIIAIEKGLPRDA